MVRTWTVRLALAAIAALAALGASAQLRRADPPVRQPMLVQPLPPGEPEPASQLRDRPAPVTKRPAAPLHDQDAFYDPAAPAFTRLQKANEALAGFPLDPGGFVDWSAALAAGLIAPRSARQASPPPPAHDLDVVLRNTKEMPWVRFPHLAHSQWLGCGSCHPEPFAEKAGGTAMSMEAILRGKACGLCHGKVAFPAWQGCERCHSVTPVATSR